MQFAALEQPGHDDGGTLAHGGHRGASVIVGTQPVQVVSGDGCDLSGWDVSDPGAVGERADVDQGRAGTCGVQLVAQPAVLVPLGVQRADQNDVGHPRLTPSPPGLLSLGSSAGGTAIPVARGPGRARPSRTGPSGNGTPPELQPADPQ